MSDGPRRVVSPEEMGLQPERWEKVLSFAKSLTDQDVLPTLSFQVVRPDRATDVFSFGTRSLGESKPIDERTLFLVASLTKPMVAMAILMLVERGELALNDRVMKILPEFKEGPKKTVTIRHLLTHTSGLPDMLPNNQELRMSQSPLSAFVEGTYKVPLDYSPGKGTQYQSMGYSLLAPIIEAVAGESYQQFMRLEVFEPLGMMDTWLGVPEDFPGLDRIAEVEVPEPQQGGTDWNWNSRYWRQLGAPWGGAITTTADVSRFCQCMLNHGTPLWSAATVREATSNRLGDFPSISSQDRDARGWGFGWRMNWKEQRGAFCDLLPPHAYGHWGATGTLCWIDPGRKIAAVLLATRSIDREVSPLVKLSNMIVSSFADGEIPSIRSRS
ncbi:MAG: beta-lactamase family protein [Planctomycetaceae bacterium]|nr:beta-lactamase family protein [Planctomycetaceae bacterium]